ncbi:lysine 6-aminotransferase [Lysobacter concretionis Ko07 = DSM 16239]|uniref:Lysine 6-aminotransferase n=1 Tax=Lysobacter concretionis Ko07 = DSM 16239 TaxID=1122185 RepID=A0A0A0ELE2_9GAMM|nr:MULTISPECIES: aminotransferase class III-fold pyridoxal phosphate-dependent enzyme [Lysobacter]KGM50948.1 lysine 6-aminotransferase [Lysobacter concretionis Ko07 = DSM 16239]QOD90372.1 aminotransferase class III-fold pyridoxal phosphate-dependent enzyme [Lysobacter sp. CW239]
MSSTTHGNAITSQLAPLRAHAGSRRTIGLDDDVLATFAGDAELIEAVAGAVTEYQRIKGEFADLLDLDEDAQAHAVQAGYVNFYQDDAVNPYIALTARGPWIVTLKGAVLHDSGGYGMLGFGHAPARVIEAMAKPQAMANIMTPSLSQLRLTKLLREAIGLGRDCPYSHFMCLNSGSESVTLAARIADANAKAMTDEGGRHAGHTTIKRVVVRGGFHGRTDRPALYSNSSRKAYEQYLASYRGENSVIVIEPYDIDALNKAFADADANGWFIEAMFLEPVMGEGDPGRSVPVDFYNAARALTKAHGALLLVDSIQAGLRANGVLSIIDYPGFEGVEAPDMETYSKALNAGQYPLSVLAVNAHAASAYKKGLYGNTMTTNPRALDTACAVLEMVTPELRENIRARGAEAIQKLEALKAELGGMITKVQGTGLLFSCELSNDFKCFGTGSTEEWLREHGIGVIHGGANSLRFTPTFTVTSAEIDLLVGMVGRALREGPRLKQAAVA